MLAVAMSTWLTALGDLQERRETRSQQTEGGSEVTDDRRWTDTNTLSLTHTLKHACFALLVRTLIDVMNYLAPCTAPLPLELND